MTNAANAWALAPSCANADGFCAMILNATYSIQRYHRASLPTRIVADMDAGLIIEAGQARIDAIRAMKRPLFADGQRRPDQ